MGPIPKCSANRDAATLIVATSVAVAAVAITLNTTGTAGSAGSNGRRQERGSYLVHQVAMCVQCHSPRGRDGQLEMNKLLTGGTIPVEQPFPEQPWALYAPRLAGLPGWEDGEVVTLLETGSRPDGTSPRRPMPPFRLRREDALAIVAYLRSLRPSR